MKRKRNNHESQESIGEAHVHRIGKFNTSSQSVFNNKGGLLEVVKLRSVAHTRVQWLGGNFLYFSLSSGSRITLTWFGSHR